MDNWMPSGLVSKTFSFGAAAESAALALAIASIKARLNVENLVFIRSDLFRLLGCRAFSWLGVEELNDRRNYRLGRFFHKPMPRTGNNLAVDIGCHEPGLLDEEVATGLLTGQHQHRHGKRRCAQLGEILRIAFEVTEIFKTGAHATRLRISFRIPSPIGFRYRMFRIGGEVVPEMFEVNPLATFDQRQGHFAVEVEMPQVAHQPDILPIADAGQKGIHQDHALGGLWKLRGVGVGHHQSDVVADDAYAIESQ